MSLLTGSRNPFFLLFVLSALFITGCGSSRGELLANAATHIEAGEIDAARQCYQSILERSPYDADALSGMVEITKGTGDDPQANEHAEWCRRLLQIRPWDRYANLAVGKHMLQQGDLKDAVVRFYMAYLDSDFAQEKQEALASFERVRFLEQQRLAPKEDSPNETTERADVAP